MLDQQMWCWGLDIRRPEGNALIAFGFRRVPVAEGVRGSNAYLMNFDERTSLVLWGSGLVFAEEGVGAVALSRFEFRAGFAESAELTAELLTAGSVPGLGPIVDRGANARANRLIRSAINAIVSYEAWAAEALGLEYRLRCVESWQKRQTPADQIVTAWRSIGDRWSESASSCSINQLSIRG